jgi:hypothetical protein
MGRRAWTWPLADWALPFCAALLLGARAAWGQWVPVPGTSQWHFQPTVQSGAVPTMGDPAHFAATPNVALHPSCAAGPPTMPCPSYGAMTFDCAPGHKGTCDGYGDGCGAIEGIGPCACGPPVVWCGGAGSLFLFREDSNHEFFSYDSAIETNQYLDARDAFDDFLPGVEAHVARFNMCTLKGVEGVYWGVFPSVTLADVYNTTVTGDLNAILNFDQLDYDGELASAFVNDAIVHRLLGETEIHNVEINRLWGVPSPCACTPWSVHLLAGFRYFDFDENLEFAADTEDATFTGDADELYYTIDCDNNLYGGQLGGYVEKSFSPRWSARFGVKAGVFANDASAISNIGGAAGTATVNNGPNDGRAWYVDSNKLDAAFLGEIHVGLGFQATKRWQLLADYRVLAASGVALPTNQIFHDLRGLQDVELTSTNGSLLLHGAFAGAQFVH